VDRVISWNKKLLPLLSLAGNKYDLVIDLHDKLASNVIKTLAGGKKTLTYQKKRALRKAIVAHKTEEEITSTTELYASALAPLHLDIALQPPMLNPQLHAQSPAREDFQSFKENHRVFIGIFPGANHITKIYPLLQLTKALSLIPEDWRPAFVLLGGEKEKPLCRILKKNLKRPCLDLSGQLNFQQLAVLVQDLDMVFSNDSGPMHLAAALQKPQVAVFGATHTRLGFAPQNEQAVVLQTNLDCQPCSLHGAEFCPKEHLRCLRTINPEQVTAAFQTLYDKYYQPRVRYLS
jgi:heptosyltransferase-2